MERPPMGKSLPEPQAGESTGHHEVEFCTKWVKFANIPKWEALEREWDRLTRSLSLEEGETRNGETPRTYLMMKDLLRGEKETGTG